MDESCDVGYAAMCASYVFSRLQSLQSAPIAEKASTRKTAIISIITTHHQRPAGSQRSDMFD